MKRKSKLKTGWQTKKTNKQKYPLIIKGRDKLNSWADKKLVNSFKTTIKLRERIVRAIIAFSLSLVVSKERIRNSHKKNELVSKTYKSISSNEFSFIPTSTAFYLFLSFVPILSIAFSILGSVPRYQFLVRDEILARFIPGLDATLEQATNIINFNNPAINFGLIVVLLTLVWISSNGYSKLIYTMSHIYNHYNYGNPLINRLKAIFMVIFITLFLTAVFFIIAPYVEFLKNEITNQTAYLAAFYISLLVFISIFYYLGFLLLFRFTPKFKLKFNQIQPGILIACVPAILITIVYGSFTNVSFLRNLGVLATIIFITTFILLISYFIYVGIIANEAYYKTYHSLRTVSKFTKKRSFFVK